MTENSKELLKAVELIRKKTGSVDAPSIGIVLGSGLGGVIDPASVTHKFRYSDLPCFPVPTVPGHEGNLLFCNISGKSAVVAQGRFHFYEGHPISTVVLPVRLFAALGVKTLILTCAAGGIAEDLAPGSIMAVTDHINLMGVNPLITLTPCPSPAPTLPSPAGGEGKWNEIHYGRGVKEGGLDRFVDMVDAYDPELLSLAEKAAVEAGIELKKGVLAAMSGPSYETPAEIRMLKTLGADAVSMSTVPEVIMARYLGLRVLALAVITNRAAGLSQKGPEHEEVLYEAGKSAKKIKAILDNVAREDA